MNAQEPTPPSPPAPDGSDQASSPTPSGLVPTARQQVQAAVHECPNCRRDFGAGVACQFCQQVAGLPSGITLSSPSKRLGGYLMEALLLLATLGIGYLIWSLIAFAKGQTPGKQVLGMKVLRLRTAQPAGWGLMFVREVIAKWLIGFLSILTLGIANFWLLWDSKNQELWDKVVATIVVDDPNRRVR